MAGSGRFLFMYRSGFLSTQYELKKMWKKVLIGGGGAGRQAWRMLAGRSSSSSNDIASAVDSMLLRSIKEHYVEASKMNPPPKYSPPSGFSIVKGALDGHGPSLTRTYGNEEISISVMRMANSQPGVDDDDDDDMNQLFIHVNVSKPGQQKSLHFLCGLYPDAVGIHSVSFRPKFGVSDSLQVPTAYDGPVFEELDEKMRDAFHNYIEERGVTENLFYFLGAWLYVKDVRNLLRWFKTLGTYVNENAFAKGA